MKRPNSAAPKIYIENRNKRYRLNTALIKKAAREVLSTVRNSCRELEFVFLDDRAIRKLNRTFKKHDRPTDVLSFELDGSGSIAISLDSARRQSAAFGTDIEEEIVLYVIHGILHLSGYDDVKAADRKRMRKKETELLVRLWMKENLFRVLIPR